MIQNESKTLKGLTVISLIGSQGSGKSTLGSVLAQYLKTLHVEVSNVVKATVNMPIARDDLHQTGMFTKDDPDWLGKAVGDRILKFLPDYKKKTAVISGTREAEVHSYLRRQGARVHIFEIVADFELRYQRLLELSKVKDARHFIRKELNESALGLDKVKEQAKYKVETSPKTNPETIVRAIQQGLVQKGIKCN